MLASADQFLVNLKHSLIDRLPEVLQMPASILLTIVPITVGFATLFALSTWAERKGLGRIQNRMGPNRVGLPFTKWKLFGLGQPIADGLKMLIKEDVVPRNADKVLHFLAPLLLLIPAFLAFSVIPYGDGIVPIDIDAGLLFFFAVGASTELLIFCAGWASRNKYALLGSMRAIAQMISYELPLIISTFSVIMAAGSLSLVSIVDAQTGSLLNWHVFTPWGLAGFILFFISSLAEANRSPFDIPEGESEIIAGHLIEYSGFKYALFFMAEYLGMFAMGGLAITLFLGGYHAPFPFLEGWLPGVFWFVLKLVTIICSFIWIRGTMPRLRMDQLMNFAWKFMLPMSLVVVVAAGIWRFAGGPLIGWPLCAALIFGAYFALSQGLYRARNWSRREYRFAE
ncbi:MAG TPA: NADH-quinone oxidoreductase subunit NuoH [Verrucomicrobiales bacterium]|nr:NADH-quinone oxidoreductase subunit NuoH [Verrucomicrobiales bacterium]